VNEFYKHFFDGMKTKNSKTSRNNLKKKHNKKKETKLAQEK
jgi:hypothetical protein